MKGQIYMVISEKYEALVKQFSELEAKHMEVTTAIDALTEDNEDLKIKIEELEKVNAEMEGKLVAFNENPNIVSEQNSKVEELTKTNGDLSARVESLEKENVELKAAVEEFSKTVETEAEKKAVEIVASNKVTQIPVSASTDAEIKLDGVRIRRL